MSKSRSRPPTSGGERTLRKILLACGVVSTLLYIALMTVVGYPGYNPISQTVSELSAIGAPSRPLAGALTVVFDLLTLAFALGVWLSAGRQRLLRIVAALMLTSAVFDLSLGPFAAMHQRDVLAAGQGTLSDELHKLLGAVDVLFMLLFMGIGAAALGRRFRLYTVASIVVLVAFGAVMTMQSPGIQADLPTPYVGLTERIMIAAAMLWRAVLASTLLRARATTDSPLAGRPKSAPGRQLRPSRQLAGGGG